MKRLASLITAIRIFTCLNAQTPHDWENPSVLSINKLPYHTTLQLPSKEKECKEIVSLDGQWFFHWSKDLESRPADFYREDYDVSSWGKINVPGNWQTQGYGTPIYSNIGYPFQRNRPSVTSEPPKDWTAYENRNPVCSYVTFINVTEEMLRNNLILHFGGVHSAMYLWINGQKVGYSQNSMSPAEFDVTSFLRKGKNKLAVEVYRWSDGSYLEDQDMWRLSGIFRSVQLWVRPLVHIADYHVEAIPNADYSDFTVKAQVSVCNTSKKTAKNQLVELQIACPELYGVNTNPNHRNVTNHRIQKLPAGDTITVELSFHYNAPPRLWSAEKPWLYPFTVELCDMKEIKNSEKFEYQFGVKRVECVGEVFKINGKNVKLRGVNRHDHHPKTGRYVDDATYEQDIRLMKQANINFLRTSHYPDREYLYELCDKWGIYVMDEANHETHGYGYANKVMGEDLSFQQAHVDRAESLADSLLTCFPTGSERFYETQRKKGKIILLSGSDGREKRALPLYRSYFDWRKEDALKVLASMTPEERQDYWMRMRPFVTDCYQLEGEDPGFLYDVALFSKGLLLQMNGLERRESIDGVLASLRLGWRDVQNRLPSDGCSIEFIQYEKDGQMHMGALVLRKKGSPVWVRMMDPEAFMDYKVNGRPNRSGHYSF